jgi:CRISPR system Cascade subunit CasC
MFREYFDENELGTRTKKIVDMVAEEILARENEKSDADAKAMAEKIINLANVSTKDGEAKALFFMSKKQAQNLAELAMRKPDATKKDAQAALNAGHGVDVALFGRMVADDPSLNTDASAQVAHSISTHKSETEYDYFTAVDDRAPEDNAGAGMLGTVEYNSATLYRYATVAAHELLEQLAGDKSALEAAIKEFTRAFITSMPTGKQNTFANRTLPDAVLISVRTDQPVNLVGAFEEPVTGEGIVKVSAQALETYAKKVYADFCGAPERAYVVGAYLPEMGERTSLPQLLERIGKEAASLCQNAG